MKYLLFLIVTLLPLSYTNAQTVGQVYVTTGNTNLRTGVSTNASVILVIPKASFVKVVDASVRDWIKVDYSGTIGYANRSLLKALSDMPTYTTRENTNLRERPTTSSAVIFTIPASTDVTIIESSNSEWWRAYYNYRIGFVHRTLLSASSQGSVRSANINDSPANRIATPLTQQSYRPITGSVIYSSHFGNGVIDEKSYCEILIKNSNSDTDAVVIFKNIRTGRVVRSIYIRAGDSYTAKNFPLGTYELKCRFGNSWSSFKDNGVGKPKGGFLEDETFSAATKAKDYFTFEQTETKTSKGINYQYSSDEVTLYKVQGGNMETKSITPDYFFD